MTRRSEFDCANGKVDFAIFLREIYMVYKKNCTPNLHGDMRVSRPGEVYNRVQYGLRMLLNCDTVGPSENVYHASLSTVRFF